MLKKYLKLNLSCSFIQKFMKKKKDRHTKNMVISEAAEVPVIGSFSFLIKGQYHFVTKSLHNSWEI